MTKDTQKPSNVYVLKPKVPPDSPPGEDSDEEERMISEEMFSKRIQHGMVPALVKGEFAGQK